MATQLLKLDTALLRPPPERQGLDAPRGILWGAGLGGLIWALLIAWLVA